MPFDKLPGHNLRIPEFRPYIPPPRPVIPWASYIVPAVDKIAQAVAYQSPYNRALRQADLSQARLSQANANLQLQLLPQRQQALQRMYGGQGGNFSYDAHGNMIPYDPLKTQHLANARLTGGILEKKKNLLDQKPTANRAQWYTQMAGFPVSSGPIQQEQDDSEMNQYINNNPASEPLTEDDEEVQ